ncbi:MFS transporter [Chloroflexota bacterium]
MTPDRFQDRDKGKNPVEPAGPKFFYGYVVAATGFAIWFLGCGGSVNFSVFLKPVLTEFGWARAETVLAYSLAMILQAPLAIIIGCLTDRIGPRFVVTVFGSFLGISYLLMSRVTDIWQFQLNYGLIGAIGISAFTIPIMATLARWFVKRRGLVMGMTQDYNKALQ